MRNNQGGFPVAHQFLCHAKWLQPVFHPKPGRIFLLLALALGACQPAIQAGTTNGVSNLPAGEAAKHALVTPHYLPLVEQSTPGYIRRSTSLPQTLPQAAIEPIRFVFPPAMPPPVSAWRPPLYPTPWALTPYDHFYFSRPIAADEVNWPLEDYRYGGVFFPGVVHTGIDIPAPKGTPVLAAGPGRVTWAGYGLFKGVVDTSDPYGQAVVVKHDFGYQGETLFTVYGHMDRIDVSLGQKVETGDELGLVGETGNVTGPHLHFEVRMGRNTFSRSRNPELWLAPPTGWGLLAARIMDSNGRFLFSQQLYLRSKETGRHWGVRSYGDGNVNSDPYYRENLVMGDLPAGSYRVWTRFEGTTYAIEIEITPGMVSYFTFWGINGFKSGDPPAPAVNFDLPVVPTSPTP